MKRIYRILPILILALSLVACAAAPTETSVVTATSPVSTLAPTATTIPPTSLPIATVAAPTTQPEAEATSSIPSEISVEETSKAIEQGAFILDVRTQEEWDQGHIEGATLIPLDQLANRLSEVPQDRQVITVCRSGKRSAQGRDILLSNGFTNVTSMSGGMNDWQAQGLPVVTD